MSRLLNMLSRLVTTFLPRSKRLLISWLQSASAVILEPQNIKSATVYTVSPSIFHEVTGLDVMIFVFWILSFKQTFLLSSFTFIKRLFCSSLSAIRVVSSAYLRLLIFLPPIQLVLHPAQHFSWCTLLLLLLLLSHFSHVRLCVTPIDGSHQAPLSLGFSRQSWFQLVLHPAQRFTWCTLHVS